MIEPETPASSCVFHTLRFPGNLTLPILWIPWKIMPSRPFFSGFWPFRRRGWLWAALKTLPTMDGFTVYTNLVTAIPLSSFSCFPDNSVILFGLLGVPPASLIKAPCCLLVLKYPHRLINHKSSKGCALDF